MKRLILSLATACAALGAPHAANAADTLSKIRDSGTAVLGVREAAAPLSYTTGNETYIGYHVELCQRVLAGIRRALSLPVLEIRYQVVTSVNRIPLVQNGTVDLECGTTTNNLARQEQVAFALTTYVTEVRMVTRKSSGITSMAQLAGRYVALTAGSTGVTVLRKYRQSTGLTVNELIAKDHADSFLLVETGRADAFIIDNNIAAGNISMAKNPSEFQVTGEVLSVEPNALMFRKNDTAFKKAVDDQIRRMIATGDLARLYDKWFMQPIPPKGIPVNLPMSEILKGAFANPNDKPAESY